MSSVPFLGMRDAVQGQDVGGAGGEECLLGTTVPFDVQGGTEDQTWSGKLPLNSS